MEEFFDEKWKLKPEFHTAPVWEVIKRAFNSILDWYYFVFIWLLSTFLWFMGEVLDFILDITKPGSGDQGNGSQGFDGSIKSALSAALLTPQVVELIETAKTLPNKEIKECGIFGVETISDSVIIEDEKLKAAENEKLKAAEEVKRIAAEEVKRIAAEEVKRIAAEEVKRIAAEEVKRMAAEEVERMAAEEVERMAAEEELVERMAAQDSMEEHKEIKEARIFGVVTISDSVIIEDEKLKVAEAERLKAAEEERLKAAQDSMKEHKVPGTTGVLDTESLEEPNLVKKQTPKKQNKRDLRPRPQRIESIGTSSNASEKKDLTMPENKGAQVAEPSIALQSTKKSGKETSIKDSVTTPMETRNRTPLKNRNRTDPKAVESKTSSKVPKYPQPTTLDKKGEASGTPVENTVSETKVVDSSQTSASATEPPIAAGKPIPQKEEDAQASVTSVPPGKTEESSNEPPEDTISEANDLCETPSRQTRKRAQQQTASGVQESAGSVPSVQETEIDSSGASTSQTRSLAEGVTGLSISSRGTSTPKKYPTLERITRSKHTPKKTPKN